MAFQADRGRQPVPKARASRRGAKIRNGEIIGLAISEIEASHGGRHITS
jgi:hypothetical protein